MITEQKLNEVGKDQYIAFVRLIGVVVAHKEHHKENAETESKEIWLDNEPDAIGKIIFKFDPKDDPRFIRIPGDKIDALWGSAENDGWEKWGQSISWLVDDFVLNDFMGPIGKPANHNLASSIENALDLQKLLDGTTDRMNMRYWDVLVIPRMSATEIEGYVDEVRSIGVAKPKSPTHAIEKSGKETKPENVSIVFDEGVGIYLKDNPKKIYPVSRWRKEYVFKIYRYRGQSMKQLKALHDQDDSVISAGIAKINDSVRSKLLEGEGADLITRNPSTGMYELNKESFSFVPPHHIE